MIPSRTLAATLSTLLAADTTLLANAVANKVGLITAPFTESLDRVMADLTIAASNGLDPVAGVAGAQLESVDPVTGELLVEIKTPAGGFRFETSSAPSPAITVYGFALGNGAMTTLIATYRLTTPIVLNAINQSITAPPLVLRIDPTKVH